MDSTIAKESTADVSGLRERFSLRSIGLSVGSAVASVLLLSLVLDWRLSVLIILQLFVHELGHAVAARKKKISIDPPVFLPFLGAFINMKEEPRDASEEATVAASGPLAGLIAAGIVLLAYHVIGAPVLLAAAHAGFLINYLNMAPMTPMDGGRMTAAINPLFWIFGVIMMAALAITVSMLLIPLLVLGVMDTVRRVGKMDEEKLPNTAIRIRWSLAYVSLTAALMLGSVLTVTPLI